MESYNVKFHFKFSIWFVFLTKPIQTGLAQFFQFGSVFFQCGSVFSGLGLVRFGFFDFILIKPKPNWSVFLKF